MYAFSTKYINLSRFLSLKNFTTNYYIKKKRDTLELQFQNIPKQELRIEVLITMSDIVSRKVHKSLKVRLYPTKNQEILFNKAFGCCRFVYNRHKEEKDSFYNENIKDKNLSKKEIQELYKTFKPKTQKEFCDEFEWLREIPAITVTDTIRKCDNAYNNFFSSVSGKRKGRKVGFPKFKSRKEKNQSFSVYMLSKDCLDWEHRLITIPKFKQVKFRHSEDKKGKWIEWFKDATPKNITISKNACGEYWCSILFEKEQDLEQTIKLSNSIGLDFSPNNLYIDNNNNSAPNYKPYKQLNSKKLTKLQRRLARKQKGSNNREKVRVKLARFEKHISDSRKDYIEKETLRLARTYDVIGIEDLNLQGMMKFSHNAKNYVDTSWYTFTQKLIWKSQFNNCIVVKSDRFYPSSKTCNHCGYINKGLTLSDRKWTCPNCSTEIIRDENAGKNLRDNAINLLVDEIKSTLGWEPSEVMSMEDTEVNLFNGEIYGVSYEVEN